MSWLSHNLEQIRDKPFSTSASWYKHWQGEWKKNVELPWKSGYDKGTKGFGSMGNPIFGIAGGSMRVLTDWYFQNTGPYKDENPAWSDVPGADDYLNAEQYKDKYGHYKGEVTTEEEEEKKKIVKPENGNGNGGDTPAASAALAALMRRRLKMRRGRSATVLTKGAKIGKGDKKQMAYA
jgi:hypothetical protein